MKKIMKKCILCGATIEITVSDDQAKELMRPNHKRIQDILPKHTPAEREMFISGICDKCFNSICDGGENIQ